MIIAWGLFISSVALCLFFILTYDKKRDGYDALIYAFIAFCSAQYIWG